MNLQAYAKIGTYDVVAQENGITVPRLRGYEWMKDREPVSQNELKQMLHDAQVQATKDGCHNRFSFAGWYWYGSQTDRLQKYYLIKNPEYKPFKECGEYIDRWIGIRWDRIHGKKRKALKFEIKKTKQRIRKNIAMWNKFCGREDILYAHARIGGNNWPMYRAQVECQSAYICHVDDWYDTTYCDIYFKLTKLPEEKTNETNVK